MPILILAAAAALALQSGATVRLQPGDNGFIEIRGQRFDPPVTIDATGASVAGLRIYDSKGIIWKGGTISAPDGKAGVHSGGYGVDIKTSEALSFDNVTFTNAVRGVVIGDSRGVSVRNSRFAGIRSDGIDMAGVSDIRVEHNSFTDFSPIHATGSRANGDWVDGDHPDAVQIWATKANPAMSDITVSNNRIEGDLQGINSFGWAGDGYHRIVIENNDVRITYPPAISLANCTDCKIRFNKVASLPGATFKANVIFKNATGEMCGNTILSIPKHPGNLHC